MVEFPTVSATLLGIIILCAKLRQKQRITICVEIFSAPWVMLFGFVTSKEVVVVPWLKKPNVELFDASGESLTICLDVTQLAKCISH